jgi:trimethylamine--corrinoid protein Co-methyltransferase
LLQQFQRYFDPALTATGEGDLAFDAVAEVGGEGHYFGIGHTRERYQTAFYQPFLSDLRNHEAWLQDGALWTAERAHRIFREIVAAFEPPRLDAAISEELESFVQRRKREGGAPTDY